MTQVPPGIIAMMAIARTKEAFHKACAADPVVSKFSFTESMMLFHLIEPHRMRDIAARLNCLPSNVTAVVDRLEADGLVRRESVVGDRRTKQLLLTPAGVEARARQMRVADRLFAELTGLSDDEMAQLIGLLTRHQSVP